MPASAAVQPPEMGLRLPVSISTSWRPVTVAEKGVPLAPTASTFTVPPVAKYSLVPVMPLRPTLRTHTPHFVRSASLPLIVNVPVWTVPPVKAPRLSHSSIWTMLVGEPGSAAESRYQCDAPCDPETLHICAFSAVCAPTSALVIGSGQLRPTTPAAGAISPSALLPPGDGPAHPTEKHAIQRR